MTVPGRPSGPVPGDPDAERVLAQALRAMAGGGKQSRSDTDDTGAGRIRLNRLQILLVAVIVGLLIGITVGLVSLIA